MRGQPARLRLPDRSPTPTPPTAGRPNTVRACPPACLRDVSALASSAPCADLTARRGDGCTSHGAIVKMFVLECVRFCSGIVSRGILTLRRDGHDPLEIETLAIHVRQCVGALRASDRRYLEHADRRRPATTAASGSIHPRPGRLPLRPRLVGGHDLRRLRPVRPVRRPGGLARLRLPPRRGRLPLVGLALDTAEAAQRPGRCATSGRSPHWRVKGWQTQQRVNDPHKGYHCVRRVEGYSDFACTPDRCNGGWHLTCRPENRSGGHEATRPPHNRRHVEVWDDQHGGLSSLVRHPWSKTVGRRSTAA